MSRIINDITFNLLAALLIFAPLARGAVHGWAVGVIFLTILAATAIYLAAGLRQGTLGWIKTPLDLPILALACLTLISLAFSVHRSTSLLASARLFSCIAIYYLAIHTVNSRSRLKTMVYLLLSISVFLSLFGLVKITGRNPFPWWEYPHQARSTFLTSTFGNHNHLAGWLEMTIPLALGFALFRLRTNRRNIFLALTLPLVAAFIFSQSRGGWIALLIGLMFMSFWLYRSNKVITSRWAAVMLNVVLLAGFFVVASTPVTERVMTAEAGLREGSLAARVYVWHGAVALAEAHPLLGSGPGTFSLSFPKYQPPGFQARFVHAHNDYLDFTAELGFGLLVIVVWMAVALYRHGIRKIQSKSRLTRGVTLGALTGITAILAHSFVDFNLQIPANALLFAVLAGLVASPRIQNNFEF